jgi:hypothetical protein
VWLSDALKGLNWPTEHAVRELRQLMLDHGTQEQMTLWDDEVRQQKASKMVIPEPINS